MLAEARARACLPPRWALSAEGLAARPGGGKRLPRAALPCVCSSQPACSCVHILQAFAAGQLLFKEPPLAAIQHTANRAGGQQCPRWQAASQPSMCSSGLHAQAACQPPL